MSPSLGQCGLRADLAAFIGTADVLRGSLGPAFSLGSVGRLLVRCRTATVWCTVLWCDAGILTRCGLRVSSAAVFSASLVYCCCVLVLVWSRGFRALDFGMCGVGMRGALIGISARPSLCRCFVAVFRAQCRCSSSASRLGPSAPSRVGILALRYWRSHGIPTRWGSSAGSIASHCLPCAGAIWAVRGILAAFWNRVVLGFWTLAILGILDGIRPHQACKKGRGKDA